MPEKANHIKDLIGTIERELYLKLGGELCVAEMNIKSLDIVIKLCMHIRERQEEIDRMYYIKRKMNNET